MLPDLDIEDQLRCPECGSVHIVRDDERGELLCNDCGIVLDIRTSMDRTILPFL